MRALIYWDTPAEIDLMRLYLTAAEHRIEVAGTPDELLELAADPEGWDVLLMNCGQPDPDGTFAMFERLRREAPQLPTVGACRQDEVFRMARFLSGGMRTFMIRDAAGDYMFLLESILASTVEAVRAEREKLVADRLREEIESVRKLQESIIPHDLECPHGFHVSAQYESSQIRVIGGQPVTLAGGDYYDVFMLDDNHMVVLVGDASGHGMKACMSIMTMHTLVSMIRTREYTDTASFVRDINRRLCQHSVLRDEGGFITLLYGILRADTGEFQWTSAGHPLPLLHHLADNRVEPLGSIDDGGLPLGIVDDAEYSMYRSQIPPGSRLMVYTDGLEEAFPYGEASHDQYGVEGICRTMRDSRSLSLDQLRRRLFDDSASYTGGVGRHDDTSIVLVERDPEPAVRNPQPVEPGAAVRRSSLNIRDRG